MTNKQKQEIDFLVNFAEIPYPSEQEIKEYLDHTTKGIQTSINSGKFNSQALFQAKRSLDMMVKMWTKDLLDGYVTFDELLEDYDSSYFRKLLRTVQSNLKLEKMPEGFLHLTCMNLLKKID